MARPTETTEAADRRAIDPGGLLLRLAFSEPGEHDLSADEFDRAKAILCSSGGLAYAYRVLDDAALLREQYGAEISFNDNAPPHNCLTELLLDDSLDLSDDTGLAPPKPQPAPASPLEGALQWLRSMRVLLAGGGMVATAAAAFLLFPLVEDNRVTGGQPVGSGVKSPHHDSFFAPPFRLVSATATGKLERSVVLEGLSHAIRDLERCGDQAERWTLSFSISPQGLASKIVVNVASASTSTVSSSTACIRGVLKRTAFGFESAPTAVVVVLDRTATVDVAP